MCKFKFKRKTHILPQHKNGLTMATGGPALNKLEDSVTCPVCLNYTRNTKQLLCGHSLCHRCVATLLNKGSVCCPHCWKYTPETAKNILITKGQFPSANVCGMV